MLSCQQLLTLAFGAACEEPQLGDACGGEGECGDKLVCDVFSPDEATCQQELLLVDRTAPEIAKGSIDSCYFTLEEAESAALEATQTSDECAEPVTKEVASTVDGGR